MKTSTTLIWLVLWAALLSLAAALVGLLWVDGGQPVAFTSLHGQAVLLYGDGLYRHDTVLIAVGYRIGDGYVLAVGLPLLLVALWRYARGSLRAGLVLAGTLAFFLYTYSSLALGAAYNELLLVYIALTALTLFGLLVALTGFDREAVAAAIDPRVPRRGIAIFLIVAGVILFLIWLGLSILPGLLSGTVPAEVASYTTVITFVWDMAVIAPALVISGLLFWRNRPLGAVLAPVMLVFIDALGLSLLAMGIGQQLAGLMSIGQFIGFVVSFAILTLFALWFTAVFFRQVNAPSPAVAQRGPASATLSSGWRR